MDQISTIEKAKIHFIDEAGIDNDESYEYGWSLLGERIYALKLGARTQRISIIGALNDNKIHSPFVFEGYTTKEVFETYLEQVLVPNIKPGDYVVIDNASFHKGGRIQQIIEQAGCTLIYLPAYSPDLNPIEHFWFSIKNAIKKSLEQAGHCLIQAAEIVFGSTGKA